MKGTSLHRVVDEKASAFLVCVCMCAQTHMCVCIFPKGFPFICCKYVNDSFYFSFSSLYFQGREKDFFPINHSNYLFMPEKGPVVLEAD